MPDDFSDVTGGGSSTAPNAVRMYTVKRGDSLSKIAKTVYGDMKRWKDIYEANKNAIGANPDHIEPGLELRLP
jgi:nucleoid-associated protein YgaU